MSNKHRMDSRAVIAVLVLLFSIAGCSRYKPLFVDTDIPERLPLELKTPGGFFHRRVDYDRKPFALMNIAATGDLMLSSWIIDVIQEQGVDYPYDSTRFIISAADLALANLEAPLTSGGDRFPDKRFTFKVPPDFVHGIKSAGFDIVNLANNHIMDYGRDGLITTLATLDSLDIFHCGAGENRRLACAPAVIDRYGVRIAFVGFSLTFPEEFWAGSTTCGTCYPSDSIVESVIAECESRADLTVVTFHWGGEKLTKPKPYQIEYAHRVIDLGADLVIGHHPHVLQGLELYKNRLIAYSLGNYAFGSYSENARDSMILQAQISPAGLVNARLFPICVLNSQVQFQPKPLRGKSAQRVLDDLNAISRHLNEGRDIVDAEGFILPCLYPLCNE
jgi:poly-gamma-glutamate capsule biosynthesis protein CapA/YwtB (metallophosphatase superfamily)